MEKRVLFVLENMKMKINTNKDSRFFFSLFLYFLFKKDSDCITDMQVVPPSIREAMRQERFLSRKWPRFAKP